jgi:hypothetical protein
MVKKIPGYPKVKLLCKNINGIHLSFIVEPWPDSSNFNFKKIVNIQSSKTLVRATLSSAQGVETSRGIQSINSYTRIQEQKYYTPSGGIQREERMRIPMPGAALKTKLASSTCPDSGDQT